MADDLDGAGDRVRRGGDGVGAGRLRRKLGRVHEGVVARVGFDLDRDAVHHLDGLDRKLADGGLGRQHDGVGAVEHGGRDVRHLGARRHRRRGHAFEHLRRDDDRLAGARAPCA